MDIIWKNDDDADVLRRKSNLINVSALSPTDNTAVFFYYEPFFHNQKNLLRER